jgi:hypothetical protein
VTYTIRDHSLALFWGRFIYLFAIIDPAIFLHFILLLIGINKGKSENLIIKTAYVVFFLFLIVAFNPLFISDIKKSANYSIIVPGSLYHLFTLFFALGCIYAFYKVIQKYKASDLISKNRLKYLIIAFVIAYIGGILHFIPAYTGLEFFPHDILIVIYTCIIFYAIVRHRLMDIEVIIKKTLVFTGILVSVFTMLIITTVLIQEYVIKPLLMMRENNGFIQLSLLSFFGIILSMTCLFLVSFLAFFTKNKVQRILFLLNLCVSIWGIGLVVIGLKNLSLSNAYLWWKITHTGGFFISVVFMHLMLELCEVKKRKILILFAYMQAVFFVILDWFNKIGYTVERVFNSFYYIKANFLYGVIVFIWLFCMFYGLYVIIKAYLKEQGRRKTQLKYLIVAMIFGFLGGTSHFYLAFGVPVYPFPIFIALYSIIQTYAIFRHNLLDIEVVIKKTLVFTGLLVSVLAVLILPTLIIQGYLLRSTEIGERLISLTVSGLTIILIFRPMKNFLARITDKYLFQKKYDYRQIMKSFIDEIVMVLDLDKIVKGTLELLGKTLHPETSVILLSNSTKDCYVEYGNIDKTKALAIGSDSQILSYLKSKKSILSIEEEDDKNITEDMKNEMANHKAILAVPFMLRNELVGIMLLGKKKSDDYYTADDLNTLMDLARTETIALKNAEFIKERDAMHAMMQEKLKDEMAVMADGMSHQFNNKFQGIAYAMGYAKRILSDMNSDAASSDLREKADRMREIIIRTENNALVGGDIARGLLNFSRPNRTVYEMVDVSANIDIARHLIGYKHPDFQQIEVTTYV